MQQCWKVSYKIIFRLSDNHPLTSFRLVSPMLTRFSFFFLKQRKSGRVLCWPCTLAFKKRSLSFVNARTLKLFLVWPHYDFLPLGKCSSQACSLKQLTLTSNTIFVTGRFASLSVVCCQIFLCTLCACKSFHIPTTWSTPWQSFLTHGSGIAVDFYAFVDQAVEGVMWYNTTCYTLNMLGQIQAYNEISTTAHPCVSQHHYFWCRSS